jgi:hypothetical protein
MVNVKPVTPEFCILRSPFYILHFRYEMAYPFV